MCSADCPVLMIIINLTHLEMEFWKNSFRSGSFSLKPCDCYHNFKKLIIFRTSLEREQILSDIQAHFFRHAIPSLSVIDYTLNICSEMWVVGWRLIGLKYFSVPAFYWVSLM